MIMIIMIMIILIITIITIIVIFYLIVIVMMIIIVIYYYGFMIIIIIDVLSIILRFCIVSEPVLTFSEMPRIPADERSAPSSDRKEEADEGIRRPQPDETQADLMTMRSPNGNSVGGVFVSPRALEQSEISTMRPTITHPVRTEEASSSNNASPVPTATVESVEETPAMKANSLVDAHYEPDEEEKVRQ